MKIRDLLKPESILINADVHSKEEAIHVLIDKHEEAGNLSDKDVYTQGILKRESESTTAIGEGIAIPHCKSDAVRRPGLTAMTVPGGIDYDAPDGRPSNLIFMIAAPMDGDLHLEVLARLMTLLMDLDLRGRLLAAESGEAFLAELHKAEAEKYPDEEESGEAARSGSADDAAQHGAADTGKTAAESGGAPEAAAAAAGSTAENADGGSAAGRAPAAADSTAFPRLLAVTACPTGIAHTYMAAEALNQKAEEMGISIKVETDGSGGAKNVLTAEEIAAAEAIIVAADRQVEMNRFAGKRVYKTPVADGINKPEELISTALSDACPIYEADTAVDSGERLDGTNESFGRKVYKSLMNGVSYMLPFVIGGGIMIALSFLIAPIAGAPRTDAFGTVTAAAAFFNGAGNLAFDFMLPVLAGFIAESIGDRPAIAVGFVGGMIAKVGATFAAPTGSDTGVSGFLGALLAGFVGGLIVLGLNKLFAGAPEFVHRMMPVLIIPLIGITLMAVFMFAVNPAVGALNHLLTAGLKSMGGTSSILLGCIVAGMMAIDMGGPFNKAAYLFGTGMLASGNYDIMAAVMIGGMVPPLGIALATSIFKNRFTKRERQSGISCYVMGLSFITEGAIPFAASDPAHVIPSCVVGSAVAGALSMVFNCTLRAPHGGIFVFPVVGHWPMYLLALLIGSVITMALLGILKKPLPAEESGLEK